MIVGIAVSRRASTGMRLIFRRWIAAVVVGRHVDCGDHLRRRYAARDHRTYPPPAAWPPTGCGFRSRAARRRGLLFRGSLATKPCADRCGARQRTLLRVSGRPRLRVIKALLYGCLINAIILGGPCARCLRSSPLTPIGAWAPGLVGIAAALLPAGHALGEPSSAITIVLLTLLVAIYSSAGGLRGVVLTDLTAVSAPLWWEPWRWAWLARQQRPCLGVLSSVTTASGLDATSLSPTAGAGWRRLPWLGGVVTALYLFVQSVANNPADGGGFHDASGSLPHARLPMLGEARLACSWCSTISLRPLAVVPGGAGRARSNPAGSCETEVFGGKVAAVATSREAAYPALIAQLLLEGLKGVLIASLMKVFMSTVDTHINWGASYLGQRCLPRGTPKANDRELLEGVAERRGLAGLRGHSERDVHRDSSRSSGALPGLRSARVWRRRPHCAGCGGG